MRRIVWSLISLCLVLFSLALLFRFDDAERFLPDPLEGLVSGVEEILSPSPEHALDALLAEEKQDDEANDDSDQEAEVYEANPRYTVEQDPERGEILRSDVQQGDTAGKILGEWLDANDLAELLAAAKPVYALTKVRFGQPFAVIRDPRTKAFRCF